MKVVLDANIIVSAVISDKGNPAKVFQMWLDEEMEVVLTLAILDEIRRVIYYPRLRKAHRLPDEEIKVFLRLIAKRAIIIDPNVELQVVADDPDDDMYIECAVSSNAEFIITGDKHLLDIESYAGIQIVNAAAFLAYLQLK
jgi:putative PIN family toxin of toxin-antitoxin system